MADFAIESKILTPKPETRFGYAAGEKQETCNEKAAESYI
jgi:hypothetical protein